MMSEEQRNSQNDFMLLSLPEEDFELNWEGCLVEETNFDEKLFDDVGGGTEEIKVETFTPSAPHVDYVGTANPLGSIGTDATLSSPGTSTDPPEVNPVASLPATNNWTGDCGFDVYFEETKPPPNGAKWTYSKLKDKIFVKKDVPLPIKFQTKQFMPYNTKIRAMVVFDQVQYANDVVHRCYNHFQLDREKGIPLANHLLKCESGQAHYEEDPISKRLCVVVQYENPQSGEKYSTYIFKFTCWGSCSGGLNRRPTKIIFTLECGGRIVGRRCLDLRICACPLRDRLSEEKWGINAKTTKRRCPNDEEEENGLISMLNGVGDQPKKKPKARASTSKGPYHISVDDYNLYLFLKEMQNFYVIYGTLQNLSPHIKQVLLRSRAAVSESSAEDKTTEESD